MKAMHTLSTIVVVLLLPVYGLSQQHRNEDRNRPGKEYTIEQATSDKAQLHTIAFNGLAFLTGSFGTDCFFPPGKVADFFGFQYMRDNDSNSMGHNTDFLTRIATNVLRILQQQQVSQLIALANEQESLYDDFARKRIVLIKAFRESMEQHKLLNKNAVIDYCSKLYAIDGILSYRRAEVMGNIIRSFTTEQKNALDQLSFGNSATWPVVKERLDKRSLSHRAHVAVMTYGSELFSWYKGSLMADVYFCPERHGTYFGGFYLKDYPAMGNNGYSIPTALTGESGKLFLDILNPEQRRQFEALPALQQKSLNAIVQLREKVSVNLRKFITGEQPDKKETIEMIEQYGRYDGELSWLYLNAFSNLYKTLTAEQKDKLKTLRNLDIYPKGIYIYSDPQPFPENMDCSMLFLNVER